MSKAIVPNLRFKEFNDDWKLIPIGSKINLLSGYAFKGLSMSENSSGIKLLRGINITEGVIRHNQTIDRYYLEGLNNIKKYIVKENDLVIAMDGSKVGKNVALITSSDEGSLLVQRVARLRSDCKTSIQFIFQLINSLRFQNYVDKVNTSSGIPHISAKQINDFQIYFPMLSEQQKIADCLSAVDELISTQAEKIATLKANKKGLMQKLFPQKGEKIPKFRFKEFSDDWKYKEIGSVFNVTRGNVLSMNDVKDKWMKTSPYPVFSSQTKNHGLAGYYSDYLYENSITWTTDGANAGDVNYRTGKFYCTNVCGVLINTDGYANTFTASLINSVSKNYVSYVGNPKLMNGVMSKIILPFPVIAEQQKIADCLSAIDELISTQAEKIATLKAHKKGLMQQLFVSN
jgi:type I restriction enzyme S subunit